jgi:hypothetical protein
VGRLAITVVGILFIAACGGEDDKASDTARAPKTKASAPEKPAQTPIPAALVGTYTVVGHKNEAFEFAGRYTLKLARTRYTTVNPLHERHGGRLAGAGNRLYFTDAGCTEEAGGYIWKLTGDKLRLTAAEPPDGCSARAEILTFANAPWRRR